MRRVTAKQLAAMVAASTGLVSSAGLTVTSLRTSLMALTPVLLASRNAIAQEEVDPIPFEVEVIDTPISVQVDEYDFTPQNIQVTLGYGSGSSADGASLSPTLKKAMGCALKYSKEINGNYGNHAGYNLQINNTEWGWGTQNPAYDSPLSTNNANIPPYPDGGYVPLDGNTQGGTTTIWMLNSQRSANYANVSLQTWLVNVIVHEWWHEWNGDNEGAAEYAGNLAMQAYIKDGGDNQNCSTG